MKRCLTESSLLRLIDVIVNGASFDTEDRELELLYEMAECWDAEITVVNYFLTKVLERFQKRGLDQTKILAEVALFDQRASVSFQTFDADFIEAMMGKLRLAGTTLEENLIDIQERLHEHRYR